MCVCVRARVCVMERAKQCNLIPVCCFEGSAVFAHLAVAQAMLSYFTQSLPVQLRPFIFLPLPDTQASQAHACPQSQPWGEGRAESLPPKKEKVSLIYAPANKCTHIHAEDN